MLFPIILLAIGFCVLLFFFRIISQNKDISMNALDAEQYKIQSKYTFLINRQKELKAELLEKQRTLTTLRNSQQGIKTFSAEDLDMDDQDESEKISRYLLQQGEISLEQNERALKQMELLKMDYLGVCIAMGFIDIETGKKALKANKLTSKTLS